MLNLTAQCYFHTVIHCVNTFYTPCMNTFVNPARTINVDVEPFYYYTVAACDYERGNIMVGLITNAVSVLLVFNICEGPEYALAAL